MGDGLDVAIPDVKGTGSGRFAPGIQSSVNLRQIRRNIHYRLLQLERTVQDCSLGRHVFEKTILPRGTRTNAHPDFASVARKRPA